MNQTNFKAALKRAYEKRHGESPKRQPQKTEDCPPLIRFAEALDHGWLPTERRHVSECEHCQKVMLYEWRLSPPSLWRLVEFIAGVFPDQRSMEMYIEESPTYARLQESAIVKALAHIVREIKGLAAPNEDFGGLFAIGFRSAVTGAVRTRGSAVLPSRSEEEALLRVRNYANKVAVTSTSDETRQDRRHEFTFDSLEGGLKVNAVVKDEQLSIKATSMAVESFGRRLLIEVLLKEGAPLALEILMKEDGATKQAIGTAEALLGRDRDPTNFSLMVTWLS